MRSVGSAERRFLACILVARQDDTDMVGLRVVKSDKNHQTVRECGQRESVCENYSSMLNIDDLMTMRMLRRGSSGLQCSEVLRKRQRNASATRILGSEV